MEAIIWELAFIQYISLAVLFAIVFTEYLLHGKRR